MMLKLRNTATRSGDVMLATLVSDALVNEKGETRTAGEAVEYLKDVYRDLKDDPLSERKADLAKKLRLLLKSQKW
jgi:hypothetical protein